MLMGLCDRPTSYLGMASLADVNEGCGSFVESLELKLRDTGCTLRLMLKIQLR